MKHRFRTKSSKRNIFFLVLVMGILIFLLLNINSAIKPIIKKQASYVAEKEAAEIIQNCVYEYLDKNKNTYNDFAAVLYNDKKQAVSIETISYTVNKTQSELTLSINKRINHICDKYTEIPVGTLTRSYLLNGKGPKIHVKISAMGSAEVKLKSELESAGINQTKHRISAVIRVKMTSSTPIMSFETTSEFEFLIAENVIFGEIPELAPYLSGYIKQ